MEKTYERINWENEPSILTPINAINLNKMDSALNQIDNRVVEMDTTKAKESDALLMFNTISYDENTGKFTFTRKNGQTVVVDTLLEKVVTNFRYDAETQQLILTTPEGEVRVDMSALITQYEFLDSENIQFVIERGKVKAKVIAGSIKDSDLEPQYLANVTAQASLAESSAMRADTDSVLARSYAVGGTGQREGEDTDNAKYYKEQAEAIVGIGIATTEKAGIVKPDGETISVDEDGTIHSIGGGKGGILPHLIIISEAGSTITVRKGDVVITPEPISAGRWQCDVDSFGVWTIDSDLDGDVAEITINVDTVKIYTIDDSHFHATITVNYPADAICRIYKGEITMYATGTPYTFSVNSTGVWTVEVSKDGQVKTETVEITTEGQSETVIITMGGYKEWLSRAGITDTFGSLEAVLNDELTVRTLMTKHASADYLLEWYGQDASMMDSFIASQYAMKWIGLRDYVCDKLMANETWQIAMLESDNWEYILKDHVPVMTSATAPYGEVSTNSEFSNYPIWQAFDGNDSTAGAFNNAVGNYVQYKFTNPIKIKKFMIQSVMGGNDTFEIRGSNDGSIWETLKSFVFSNGTHEIENEKYFIYYRLVQMTKTRTQAQTTGFLTLQFYGRSLNVSVPVMTSATSAYGEVSSTAFASGYDGWKAFDGSEADNHNFNGSTTPAWISYKFTTPACIKEIYVSDRAMNRIKTYKFQGSNDGVDWVDLTDVITHSNTQRYTTIENNNNYLYYRLFVTSWVSAATIFGLQFYGVDYTEREDRRYIYDHGIEIETVTQRGISSQGEIKENGRLKINASVANAGFFTELDITPYKLARVKMDSEQTNITNAMLFAYNGQNASKNFTVADAPFNEYLDITNMNGNSSIFYETNNSSATISTINEWWLE